MTSHVIDRELLYYHVDKRRRARRIPWRQVARETRITPSSLTRWYRGDGLSADATASLMAWTQQPLALFVRERGSRSMLATSGGK